MAWGSKSGPMRPMAAVRSAALVTAAKERAAAGHHVLAGIISEGVTQTHMTGPDQAWSDIVEAVEAEGWRLDKWAPVVDEHDRKIRITVVFRR